MLLAAGCVWWSHLWPAWPPVAWALLAAPALMTWAWRRPVPATTIALGAGLGLALSAVPRSGPLAHLLTATIIAGGTWWIAGERMRRVRP